MEATPKTAVSIVDATNNFLTSAKGTLKEIILDQFGMTDKEPKAITDEWLAKISDGEYSIANHSDSASYDKVRKALAQFRTTRTTIEKKRKELNELPKTIKSEIDDFAKEVTGYIVSVESKLSDEIDRIDKIKEEIKAEKLRKEQEIIDAKIKQLLDAGCEFTGDAYVIDDLIISSISVKHSDAETFTQILASATTAGVAKRQKELEIKAEEDRRIAEEKRAEAEEKDRLRIQREEQEAESKRLNEIRKEQEKQAQELERQREEQQKEAKRIEDFKQQQAAEAARLIRQSRINKMSALGYSFNGTAFSRDFGYGIVCPVGDVTRSSEEDFEKDLKEIEDGNEHWIKKAAAAKAQAEKEAAEILQKQIEEKRLREEEEERERIASLGDKAKFLLIRERLAAVVEGIEVKSNKSKALLVEITNDIQAIDKKLAL